MAKVSIKKADYLLDEKLMSPKFRRGYQIEYAKVLLVQKIAEMLDSFRGVLIRRKLN